MKKSPEKERNIQALGILACSEVDSPQWRNNIGQAITQDGRRINYGVGGKGGLDTVGYTSIIITPEMVGMKIAVYTETEYKSANGRATPEQLARIAMINAAGGRAGIARSAEDAVRIACGDHLNTP